MKIKSHVVYMCVLLPEKVSQLQEEYRKAILDYAKILEEYEKAGERAPGKDTWNTPGRILNDLERQLLSGPLGNVKYYKKITVRDRITNRQIEYSCTSMPLLSSSIPKQSSSFVFISNPTDEKPIFGVIVRLFSHNANIFGQIWNSLQQ